MQTFLKNYIQNRVQNINNKLSHKSHHQRKNIFHSIASIQTAPTWAMLRQTSGVLVPCVCPGLPWVSERAALPLVICAVSMSISWKVQQHSAVNHPILLLVKFWRTYFLTEINKYNSTSLFGCVWDLSMKWSQSWNDLHGWANNSATVWWMSSPRINLKVSKSRFFFFFFYISAGVVDE